MEIREEVKHLLWKNYYFYREKTGEFPSVRQCIGQLKAERNNLEKLNHPLLTNEILNYALAEEKLKKMNEEMLETFIDEQNKKEKNGVWGLPQNEK